MENNKYESKELPLESLEDKIRRIEEEIKQAKSHLEQQKQADVSGTIQENAPKKLQDKASLTPPEIYEKRKGVVDQEKEFECTMCALYALKFSTSDTVLSFKMTTNNNKCGYFDDIEIDVTFTNGTKNIFLFQLRHNDSKEQITQETLTKQFFQGNKKQEVNKFYLLSYLESISQLQTKNKDSVYILYTNNSTNIANASQLTFKPHISLVVQSGTLLEHEDLLLNSAEKSSPFQFLPKSLTENQEHEKVCKQFFLFTHQKNLKMARDDVQQILETFLSSDIYQPFDNFIRNWLSANYTLTKHDVIAKLTELSLSPYIELISGNRSNENLKLIEKAGMEFELTIFESFEDNNLQNIWTTVEENYDCNDLMKKYQLTADAKTKLLWFSDLRSIIVEVNESNEEKVKRTMNFLRRDLQNKRIVLVGNVKREDFENWVIFEHLADLKETKEFYEKLVGTFNVSLQGKEPISLKQLADVDETIAQNITTKILLEMSQKEYLVIGKQKEKLSELHIQRTVSAALIDLAWILKYSTRKNCVIILNCSNEFEQKLQLRDINVVQLSKFRNEEKQPLQKLVLVVTQDKCTYVQFEKVCEKTPSSNVYVFQVFSDENCILLYSKGEKLECGTDYSGTNKLQISFKEEEIFEHFGTNLNVFCAPPGMGKSTLLQLLRDNCPEDCWSIYVNLIDHNHFLSSNPDDIEILNRFLQTHNSNSLDSKIQSILLLNRKIYLFLDGLDEVESKCVDVVLNFAKYISKDGVSVWMSSRQNLRENISSTLHVVPIEIDKLSEEQQKKYIDKRLNRKYQTEEIEIIFKTVSESAHVASSQELLGIPMQLFIMTETFLYNEAMYENIKEDMFVLTKMYNLFFEEKIKYSIEKRGVQAAHQLELGSQELLERYEIPALRSCLDRDDFVKLNVETNTCECFLTKIKENGDKYCIIKSVSDGDQAVFNHQTYAEYFACVWFKNNLGKVRLLKNRWFSGKYQNLSLIFDIMVAERNPLHLAVIYKNIKLVEKHIKSIDEKNWKGQTALQLACQRAQIENVKKLLDSGSNVHLVDKEDWNALHYAAQSDENNSEAIGLLLTAGVDVDAQNNVGQTALQLASELCRLENVKKLLDCGANVNLVDRDDWNALHYAADSDENNSEIIELLLDGGVDLDDQNNEGQTALQLACKEAQVENVKKLLNRGSNVHLVDNDEYRNALHYAVSLYENNSEIIQLLLEYGVKVDAQNQEGQTALQLACQRAQTENVKKLLDNGSNVHLVDNESWNALHHAAQLEKNNSEVIGLLLDLGVDVDTKNISGQTPLQLACELNRLENVKKLLDCGANVHLVDNENCNALHYAANSYKNNSKIIELLLDGGVDVDVQNMEGETALQLASSQGQIQNFIKLLDRGSNVHLVDNENRNALHYAALSENNSEIIQLLLDGGVDVDAQNKKGQTALHNLCGRGQIENVKKLINRGSDVNLVDNENSNALHYAAGHRKDNSELINLLIGKGFNVNSQNLKKETPLHIACQSQNFENMSCLLKYGANMYAVSHGGRNILRHAATSWNSELIQEILNSGFDVNACNDDDDGVNVLHFACKNCNFKIVKVLIDGNANIHSVDKQRRTPLHYAVENTVADKKEITKYLIESGIDINALDSNGKCAMDYAIESNQFGIFKILIENHNIRIINDPEIFLYFSVYSGCSLGLELFINSGIDLTKIDVNNKDYPLYFAAVNGALDTDSLTNMTKFINKILLSNVWASVSTISRYLKDLALKNSQINWIFKEVDEPLKMDKRIKDFDSWLDGW